MKGMPDLQTVASTVGRDREATSRVVGGLDSLLADLHVHYQNLRGFHWNVQGPQFFSLHRMFEERYTATQTRIDEIAERILSLGGRPDWPLSGMIARAGVSEGTGAESAADMVRVVLDDLEALLLRERAVLKEAGEANDEGTVDMLGGYVSAHEKTAWMLRAWLGDA